MKIRFKWDVQSLRFRVSMVALTVSFILSACAPATAPAAVQSSEKQAAAQNASSADTQAAQPVASAAKVENAPVAVVATLKNKFMLFGAVY